MPREPITFPPATPDWAGDGPMRPVGMMFHDSCEDEARAVLARLGFDAGALSAGDLVELANLINAARWAAAQGFGWRK